jgi:hypothetical protein
MGRRLTGRYSRRSKGAVADAVCVSRGASARACSRPPDGNSCQESVFRGRMATSACPVCHRGDCPDRQNTLYLPGPRSTDVKHIGEDSFSWILNVRRDVQKAIVERSGGMEKCSLTSLEPPGLPSRYCCCVRCLWLEKVLHRSLRPGGLYDGFPAGTGLPTGQMSRQ